MSASVFSTLSGKLTGKHPELGILCRETGEVLLPPCFKIHRFKHTWTYGCKNSYGYLQVKYRGKTYQVHQLIAKTFLSNHANLPTVDHISRDKLDNRPSNLRYASHKLQADNRQICLDSLAMYGVRRAEDPHAYDRARYANNPEQKRARCYDYFRRQKALGKRRRICPDGKKHWLTDEEFNKRYGK